MGLFFACWIAAALDAVGLVSLAGTLWVSLYGLYATAAALGWLAGNVYVHRRRSLPRRLARRVLVIYFIGPLGLVYLLRFMAPEAAQRAAPLVPLYAAGVFGALFLVPVLLRPRRPRPPRIGS